ncbi:MAG: immunoglobulin domain-containing protein [Planctomycetaceae bacterium]|nr:immunoglobulin domain-containing protein [Planctomycetaceae bacterium]
MRRVMYLTFVMALGAAGVLNAGVISLNLDNATALPGTMEVTDLAGAPGVRVGNWNNWIRYDSIIGDAGQNIIDDSGTVVPGFTANISSNNFLSRDNNHDNDQELYSDIVDILGAVTLTASNVPYSVYDVYVYMKSDGAARGGSFAIGGTTYYARGGLTDPLSNGTGYVLSSDTTLGAGTDVNQGNYVRFANISGSSFTLTINVFNAGDSVRRNKVAGFQIVEKRISPIAPAEGAVNVALDQDLQWSVNDPVIAYIDLYFGTDPNWVGHPTEKKLSMVPATTVAFEPGTFSYSTPYYWQIDAYEPNTAPGGTGYVKVAGALWTFTSIGPAPMVSAVEPALTTVNAGENAVLAITATNADFYRWYKVGSPDTALSDGTDYAGCTTNTLTIYNVQAADEGNYYCRVSNSVYPDAVNSEPGAVMTRRLIIHYPLDTVISGVTPDVVSGYDMTLMTAGAGTAKPSLAAGVSELGGSGLFFNNSNSADPNAWGQYAAAGDVDMEAAGDGLTIALWVNRLANEDTSNGILSRRTEWSATEMVWQLEYSQGAGGVSFTRSGTTWPAGVTFNTGEWMYVVATFDPAATTARIYVNGEYESESTAFTLGPATNSLFRMGCNQLDTLGNIVDPFHGTIDDVKIYNYARTAAQIAQDYLSIKGGWICDNEGPNNVAYDFDGNCQVDLADFAAFAATWLNNNRVYPQ